MAGRLPYTSLSEIIAVTDSYIDLDFFYYTGQLSAGGGNQYIEVLAPENYSAEPFNFYASFEKPSTKYGATSGTFDFRVRTNSGQLTVLNVVCPYNERISYGTSRWDILTSPNMDIYPSEVQENMLEKMRFYYNDVDSLRVYVYNNTDVVIDHDASSLQVFGMSTKFTKVS